MSMCAINQQRMTGPLAAVHHSSVPLGAINVLLEENRQTLRRFLLGEKTHTSDNLQPLHDGALARLCARVIVEDLFPFSATCSPLTRAEAAGRLECS